MGALDGGWGQGGVAGDHRLARVELGGEEEEAAG